MSTSTERRWYWPDILVAMSTALAAVLLLVWPVASFVMLSVRNGSPEAGQWAALPPPDTSEPAAAIWIGSILLLVSSVLATFAHRALRVKNNPMSLLTHGGTAILAIAFIAVQVAFAQDQMFAPATLDEAYLSLLLGDHGLALLLGLVLLGVSMVLGAMRMPLGAMPANEAAIWFWHMIDAAWFTLIFIAYSGDLLQHL